MRLRRVTPSTRTSTSCSTSIGIRRSSQWKTSAASTTLATATSTAAPAISTRAPGVGLLGMRIERPHEQRMDRRSICGMGRKFVRAGHERLAGGADARRRLAQPCRRQRAAARWSPCSCWGSATSAIDGHPPPSQQLSIFWRQSWHHHAERIQKRRWSVPVNGQSTGRCCRTTRTLSARRARRDPVPHLNILRKSRPRMRLFGGLCKVRDRLQHSESLHFRSCILLPRILHLGSSGIG